MDACCKDLALYWLLTASLALLVIRPGVAGEFACPAQRTRVVAEDAGDAALACDGAAAARGFLAAQHLDVDTEIRIEIVPVLSEDDQCEAAGYYFATDDRVVVLESAEFRKYQTWLRVPVSDALYRAVVAHEVAHLIASRNFTIRQPTIQAQEYIAYVTTLATLAPDLRAQVLAQFSGDGYETEQQMNTTIYLCDPMRFGVEAYRHFLKKGGETGYFARILTGRVLAH